jgi:hypothetical protein
MFSTELLEQREKVRKECIKLQALLDGELEDSTFICHAIWSQTLFMQHLTSLEKKKEQGRKIKRIMKM